MPRNCKCNKINKEDTCSLKEIYISEPNVELNKNVFGLI